METILSDLTYDFVEKRISYNLILTISAYFT